MKDTCYELQTFSGIKLTEETIENCEFIDCEFINCIFESCILTGCSFTNCNFSKCNVISLRTKYSIMKHSSFTGCNLIGVHWQDLFAAGGIAGPIKSLSGCVLKYNSFTEMSLRSFEFAGNSIQNTTFDQCKLMDSSFAGCKLEDTEFTGCDLQRADFREANGYHIDTFSNKLKNAKFSFPEVVRLLSGLGIKIE